MKTIPISELRSRWSVWVAVFWSIIYGIILIWPGIAGSIPTKAYAAIGIITGASYGVARWLKQPGTDQ